MFRPHEGTMRLIMTSSVECVTVLFGFVTNLGQISFLFSSDTTLCSVILCSPVAPMSYSDNKSK